MRAPRFWYQREGILARLLSPLGLFYRFASTARRAWAHPYRASIPVICVGNAVAGGSGKTPTALALAELLQKQGHNPVFVTRGYGGTERGPLRVDPAFHSASDVGDEALLLCRQAPVWIGRDRAAAIRAAEKYASHIILDDGLQNPHILPDVSLLVIDGSVGIGNGHIIPAGPLREPLADAMKRVQAVLIIGDSCGDDFADWIKPVLHATLKPVISVNFPRNGKILAFAGIGRPEKFYDLCRKEGLTMIATENFADHHPFTQEELDRLEQKAKSLNAHLLTTEKDFVRLPDSFRAKVLTFPVKLEFGDVAGIQKLLTIATSS